MEVFLRLTRADGTAILVNGEAIAYALPEKNSTVIHLIDRPGESFTVKESLDRISGTLGAKGA
jgi:uncharacterized protein YlzI (FlbEa/FlbD family)